MKLGPKYKIARRLGAPIFEKTQTQQYNVSLARKEKNKRRGRPKKPSEYGIQLNEKQKARFTYGITEKQFRKYVDEAVKAPQPADKLFELLERRLDNALYRAGFTQTRAQARQTASHGHSMVNGRRVTIPSIRLKKGDKISLRPASAESSLFADVAERMKTLDVPAWLKVDADKREVEVVGEPVLAKGEQLFDLGAVIEFYNR